MNPAGGTNRAGGTTHMSDETRDGAAHQVNQHRGLCILWLLPAALFLIAGPLVTPAHAATTTGCSGTAVSFSDRGIPLDKVSAPGPGGTQARPFQIMWAGNIEWNGQTAQVIQHGSWRVTVRNSSLLFRLGELATGHPNGVSGSIVNDGGLTTRNGTFAPSSKVPVMFPGTYVVTILATGQNGATCTGTVWVKVVNSPTGTPLFWAATILILIALIMLAYIGYTKWIGPLLTRKGD